MNLYRARYLHKSKDELAEAFADQLGTQYANDQWTLIDENGPGCGVVVYVTEIAFANDVAVSVSRYKAMKASIA